MDGNELAGVVTAQAFSIGCGMRMRISAPSPWRCTRIRMGSLMVFSSAATQGDLDVAEGDVILAVSGAGDSADAHALGELDLDFGVG